jgi:hypothetical protein
VMDEGINLAKTGAFEEGGVLSGTPGQPIRLPGNFHRRGFVCHFQERDSVVRVV